MNFIGQKFNEWRIIEESNKRGKSRQIYVLAECSCGTRREVLLSTLRNNKTISCGCKVSLLNKDILTCNECGLEKPITDMVKNLKIKRGYNLQCKMCSNQKQRNSRSANLSADVKKYEKTPNGYLMRTYRNMLSRVRGVQKKKAHLYEGLEILDKESFYLWSSENIQFNTLFSEYVESGYNRKLSPSIDRIDSDKGYTIDNIRWITHSENSSIGAKSEKRFK